MLAVALLQGRASNLPLARHRIFETFCNRNLVYAVHKRTKKDGTFSCDGGKTCSALRRCGELSSVYYYICMTNSMQHPITLPSLVSIARELQEEFVNKGFQLYQNI